jgi:hypothetical protein
MLAVSLLKLLGWMLCGETSGGGAWQGVGSCSPLSVEDTEHIAAAAGNHKTMLAATRTQAIQLLDLVW